MKSYWALALASSVTFVAALLLALVGGSSISGDELAREWIQKAETADGRIEFPQPSGEACFVAESNYAPGFIYFRFPGYKIAHEEKTDRSEGFWYFILLDNKNKSAKIYAVDQTVLRWQVPESALVSESEKCGRAIKIKVANGEPELIAIDD